MKYFIAALMLAFGLNANAEWIWGDTYNWESPLTLTPPFSPATAENRSGDYVGGVEFKGNYSTITIDDSAKKEQSQSARFYFGYLTQTNELRVYPGSIIKIVGSERQTIRGVRFSGAKVGAEYLEANIADGKWDEGLWGVNTEEVTEVSFTVLATINCTQITVSGNDWDSVDDISVDTEGEIVSWTDMQGRTYNERPQTAGIYLCRYSNGKVARTLVR